MSRLHSALSRLFRHEEINGGERCPTYLHRWTLFQPRWRWLKGVGVYLHHFVGDDWSRDLHDHPKRFISVGLSGAYVEETFLPGAEQCPCDRFNEHVRSRVFRAPWIRTFPATHTHRLHLIDGQPCWTLVIVLRASRPWGFWHRGRWFPWRQYVNSDMADRMKTCPGEELAS